MDTLGAIRATKASGGPELNSPIFVVVRFCSSRSKTAHPHREEIN